jgi:hypothetical protein
MKISEKLSYAGLFCFITGVTVSSLVMGAQSIPYFIAIGLAIVLSLPFMLSMAKKQVITMIWISLILLAPVVLCYIHIYMFNLFVDDGSVYLQYMAIPCAIWLATATGMLSSNMFKSLMFWICIVHILICLHGLYNHSIQISVDVNDRSITDEVSVSVWGEIAFGTIIAALLSNSVVLIVIATVIAGRIIIDTQVRCCYISCCGFCHLFLNSNMEGG